MRTLAENLECRAKHHRHLGQANYGAVVLVFLVAVGSSVVATFVVRTRATWLPFITGLPALALLVNGFFRFEQKSVWHFERAPNWTRSIGRLRSAIWMRTLQLTGGPRWIKKWTRNGQDSVHFHQAAQQQDEQARNKAQAIRPGVVRNRLLRSYSALPSSKLATGFGVTQESQ